MLARISKTNKCIAPQALNSASQKTSLEIEQIEPADIDPKGDSKRQREKQMGPIAAELMLSAGSCAFCVKSTQCHNLQMSLMNCCCLCSPL